MYYYEVETYSKLKVVTEEDSISLRAWDFVQLVKVEVHPKIKKSCLIVFKALSRMVKVRGPCDKPFWINKQVNNHEAPAPDSDHVLLVEKKAF